MAPEVDAVRSDENLPGHTGVVVIGGGIIGTCTALFLARKGVPVVLCEKGHIAGEQSSRNWGWCRKMGRDPRELPLIIDALRLWRDLDRSIEGDTGYRTCGITYLAATQAELAQHEAWIEHARQYQLDTRLLSTDEVAALFPQSQQRWVGAMHTPSDGRAEPQRAAPAIAEAARRAGATILTQCAVRGIETTGGRVSGVVTEKGHISCSDVVLAGGAWSSLFCGNLGLRLPQLKVLASVMRTERLDGGPEGSASGAGFGFRKRLDGGYNVSQSRANITEITPDSFRYFRDFLPALRQEWSGMRLRIGPQSWREVRMKTRWNLDQVSPFENVRTLDPAPSDSILDAAQRNLAAAFAVFGKARIAQRWGGLIDVTPDAVPVISGVDTIPGFYVSTGYSGHGFGIGPGAGRLMADLVTGDTPAVDPSAFRFSRFSDGTRPQPQPL
jgi:glycine/D-amino acid oxidase-like deaminating enzyme